VDALVIGDDPFFVAQQKQRVSFEAAAGCRVKQHEALSWLSHLSSCRPKGVTNLSG
jgi:hypothetical protein